MTSSLTNSQLFAFEMHSAHYSRAGRETPENLQRMLMEELADLVNELVNTRGFFSQASAFGEGPIGENGLEIDITISSRGISVAPLSDGDSPERVTLLPPIRDEEKEELSSVQRRILEKADAIYLRYLESLQPLVRVGGAATRHQTTNPLQTIISNAPARSNHEESSSDSEEEDFSTSPLPPSDSDSDTATINPNTNSTRTQGSGGTEAADTHPPLFPFSHRGVRWTGNPERVSLSLHGRISPRTIPGLQTPASSGLRLEPSLARGLLGGAGILSAALPPTGRRPSDHRRLPHAHERPADLSRRELTGLEQTPSPLSRIREPESTRDEEAASEALALSRRTTRNPSDEEQIHTSAPSSWQRWALAAVSGAALVAAGDGSAGPALREGLLSIKGRIRRA